MSNYTEKDHYIVIRRHFILLFFKLAKFIFLLLVSFFIYWTLLNYWDVIWQDFISINYIVFTFCFVTLNYAFITLIIYFIEYYNKIIIITNEEIIFLRSTLILRDDLEVLDLYRIMSIDTFCHWLFANIFNYWEVVIEQQQLDDNENIKKIYFIPNPYKFISIIKEKKKKVLEERKKRYIVNRDTNWNNIELKKI